MHLGLFQGIFEIFPIEHLSKLSVLALLGWLIAIAFTSEALGGWCDPIAAAILIVGIIAIIVTHLHMKNLL